MKATNVQYQNFNRRFAVVKARSKKQEARNLFKTEESSSKSEKLPEIRKVG